MCTNAESAPLQTRTLNFQKLTREPETGACNRAVQQSPDYKMKHTSNCTDKALACLRPSSAHTQAENPKGRFL